MIYKCTINFAVFFNQLSGLLYGIAISDALGLNTEGLSVEECNFFYETENISLDSRICDHLRTHFPPHDWSSNTDVVVSLCCLESHGPFRSILEIDALESLG